MFFHQVDEGRKLWSNLVGPAAHHLPGQAHSNSLKALFLTIKRQVIQKLISPDESQKPWGGYASRKDRRRGRSHPEDRLLFIP
jgi:hypothetical protein